MVLDAHRFCGQAAPLPSVFSRWHLMRCTTRSSRIIIDWVGISAGRRRCVCIWFPDCLNWPIAMGGAPFAWSARLALQLAFTANRVRLLSTSAVVLRAVQFSPQPKAKWKSKSY